MLFPGFFLHHNHDQRYCLPGPEICTSRIVVDHQWHHLRLRNDEEQFLSVCGLVRRLSRSIEGSVAHPPTGNHEWAGEDLGEDCRVWRQLGRIVLWTVEGRSGQPEEARNEPDS